MCSSACSGSKAHSCKLLTRRISRFSTNSSGAEGLLKWEMDSEEMSEALKIIIHGLNFNFMTVTTTQENEISPIVSGPGYRYIAGRAKSGVDTGMGIDTSYASTKVAPLSMEVTVI